MTAVHSPENNKRLDIHLQIKHCCNIGRFVTG